VSWNLENCSHGDGTKAQVHRECEDCAYYHDFPNGSVCWHCDNNEKSGHTHWAPPGYLRVWREQEL